MQARWIAAVVTAAVCLVVGTASATDRWDHDDDDGWFGEERRLTGSLSGKQFVAGPKVVIDAEVDDDIFAAGADVELRGAKARDVFAAGAFVGLRQVAIEDGILSGGKVQVQGTLSGDLMAAGGAIELEPDSQVQGDALVAGGRIALYGSIGGRVEAAAGHLRIAGRIEGPVEIAAEKIVMGPNAHVVGDLVYTSPQQIEMAEGARIDGQLERRRMPVPEFGLPGVVGLIFAGIFTWVGGVLSLIVLAAGLLAVFPRLVAGASDGLVLRPWPSLALGLALLFALPVGAAIVMATVVGLPLGVAGLLLYVVGLLFAVIIAALAIGQHLPRLGDRHAAHIGFGWRLGRAAAGVVVLALVGLVPFLGGLVLLLSAAFGLGALGLQAWRLIGGEPVSP